MENKRVSIRKYPIYPFFFLVSSHTFNIPRYLNTNTVLKIALIFTRASSIKIHFKIAIFHWKIWFISVANSVCWFREREIERKTEDEKVIERFESERERENRTTSTFTLEMDMCNNIFNTTTYGIENLGEASNRKGSNQEGKQRKVRNENWMSVHVCVLWNLKFLAQIRKQWWNRIATLSTVFVLSTTHTHTHIALEPSRAETDMFGLGLINCATIPIFNSA